MNNSKGVVIEPKLSREDKLEEARKEVLMDRACIFRIFQSDDGRKALEILRHNFSNRTSIVPGDPYATHAQEGAREVILFIEEILQDANQRD